MSTSHAPADGAYYVPAPSWIPFLMTAAMTLFVFGMGQLFEGTSAGKALFFTGAAAIITVVVFWFRAVIHESESGQYNQQVDMTYRWAMCWFIFSEVMFFGAFFGSLYYARTLSLPWLGGEGTGLATGVYLWPGFEAMWPSAGPDELGGAFGLISPWGLPLLNTLLLLTSGVTLTIAHHALKENKRGKTIVFMWATVALGAAFLFFQAQEYVHAYVDLNLTLGSGIYGSTLFMLTGFHGIHVCIGTIMLLVITLRLMRGHFKPDSHFGFEAVAWYWHFVDVVWLGLFVFVYVL